MLIEHGEFLLACSCVWGLTWLAWSATIKDNVDVSGEMFPVRHDERMRV